MKKKISLFVMGIIAITSATTYAATGANVTGENLSANEKAIKKQEEIYGADANVKWFDAGNGFIAHFTKDDMNGTSAFDEKGKWVYTIFQYNEDKMSDELKERIKSVYYMDNIKVVQQVEQPSGDVVYLVHLENKNKVKTVRLDNTDMQVIEEFEKG